MFKVEKRSFWVWFSFGAYLGMILVNALANLIPINGITTGEVSDSYFNLFAPTGLTFSIWGIIYLLLGAYVVWQLTTLRIHEGERINPIYIKINGVFAISSLANILWVFAWHYRFILGSVLLMLILLGCLIWISFPLRKTSALPKAAFGLYFGWITVATIANITVYLVRLGVPNDTVGATLQTMIILLVGMAIGGVTIWVQKNAAYGLALLWAYLGIYLKHIDPTQFDRGYSAVFNTALAGMIGMGLVLVFVLLRPLFRQMIASKKKA